MAYTPPAGDQANFELLVYTPPAGDAVNFDLSSAIPSERSSETQGIGTGSSERSSEVVGINFVPTKLAYRIIVHDENDALLGEFESFKALKFGKRLNNYGMAEFQILVNDPKLSELISLRRYSVHIYRKSGMDLVRVWAGQQALRSGSLDSKGLGWVTIRCFTWLELLNMRYTSANQVYTTVDAGDIGWDLIDRTQRQWVEANTGSIFPGTVVDDSSIGSETWGTEVNNIKLDDDQYVTFEPYAPAHLISHYLKMTNFGFSIPSEANILGIKVELQAFAENDSSIYIYSSDVRLVKAGTIQSNNRGDNQKWSSHSPIDENNILYYGSESDLWDDTTLTPSDINNSGFGIALSATGVGIADGFSNPGDLDYCKVAVYYEYPTDDPNGDFGITQGSIEATIDRDRTYQNDNVLDALLALTNVLSGFDAEITDDKVFNVYSTQGTDLTNSIILEYGKNIESVRIDEDFIHPVNRAIILGEAVGQDDLQRVERNETNSQDDFKIRESVDTEPTVSEIETLEDKGDAMLRKYIVPLLKVDINLVKGCAENITQFGVGDLIRLIVKYGLYDIDEEYRIFEWEVNYDQEGAETLSLILGRFTLPTPLFS